jgi:hypothetical protein
MQQISKKHAPREKKNIHCRKHKKTYLGMMKNMFCQDINMQKMTGFLDEKYTREI